MAGRIWSGTGAAIVAAWIAIAIIREHSYGRALLSATGATLAYGLIVDVIAMRSLDAMNSLAPPGVVLAYLIFSRDVAEYDRGLRH